MFTTLAFCANSSAVELFGVKLFGYDSFEECKFDKIKQCKKNDRGCQGAAASLCAKECPLVDKYLDNIPIKHPKLLGWNSDLWVDMSGVMVSRVFYKMKKSLKSVWVIFKKNMI